MRAREGGAATPGLRACSGRLGACRADCGPPLARVRRRAALTRGWALTALVAPLALPAGLTAQEVADNALTAAERAAGWELLFDGRTTGGWRGYQDTAMPAGWRVEDGLLTRAARAGDIVTVERFADFELLVEWRVAEGGNSGIFYRGDESEDAIFKTAPEMQVLDDARHRDGRSPLTSAGAVYGLYPAPRGVVRPAGEWNQARIRAEGRWVEHWLNGRMIARYEQGGEEWNRLVAGSKFVEWPSFGTLLEGHIGLQDHGDRVWYRNIKIRRLP